ncbi:NADH dehydrogenase subunit C [Sphingobium indicum IP26]|uniref:NADH-quinone oxidoreductase subunit C n=1 Tax=Sphingobium indicum F2 TaxID=1450518 RepID=A0A8E0WQP4_9SPHN|nr:MULTISPECIES: NADH-quinone oxidoreductase subunit C [Sphingobium]EPR16467.1 NADH dehydrogenase subunit C [Sphingobium indicum IP26]EQA98885.1 NADH dehydrogenase subunit C [Sphingobium sp. HDIP04]KER35651.1 NADH dehydrogenase [Sphingobium indicum F2]
MGHSAPRIATIDGIAQEIAGLLGSMLVETVDHADELSFTVVREKLAEAMVLLRDKAQYQQLMEIAGVDYPERPERFEVCYHLLSVTRNHRVRVKVQTDEDTPVPTVTHIWPVAGWLEREVFDMYGVIFEGNADLRRILTDYGFKGHPQRKDFPLTGYVEMWYSEEDKRVVYKPVKLAQDFRNFDFMSPWEGAQYVLPGDEKAPQAPGAPTPVAAPLPAAGAAPKGEPKGDTPKVTEKTAETGAGEPANKEAAKPTEAKPVPEGARTSEGEAVVEPAHNPGSVKADQGQGAAKPEDKA